MRRSPVSCRLLALALAAFSGSAAFAQLPAGQVFADVPGTAPWYNATNTLHQLGISVGCDSVPNFCPTQSLLRQDMAVFIVTAWSARVWNDPGAFVTQAPPSASPYFSDVPTSSLQFPYIQKLYELGVTAGTVAPQLDANGHVTVLGQFSPSGTLTNYQIAVFATVAGALAANACTAPYFPTNAPKPFPVSTNPSCAPGYFGSGPSQTPYFSDVVSGSYFKFVQQLGDSNGFASPSPITGYPGCGACVFGGNNTVTRGQMAIWTVVGMGLQPRSVLSMGGGSNSYAVQPTITVPFTFTLYNQGPASVEYGQFLLSNGGSDTIPNQGPTYCYGDWGPPAALALYDATPETAAGYNQPLYDGFCTVSLVSVASITNGLQVTVNFTFNPIAAGVTYNVFHDAIYNGGLDPWENVGTLQVLTPPSLNPAPTVTLTDASQSSGFYLVGDSYTMAVTGPPNLPVSLTVNGVATGPSGNTGPSGVYTFSGAWTSANIGSYTDIWYVNGAAASPSLIFSVAQQSCTVPQPSWSGLQTSLSVTDPAYQYVAGNYAAVTLLFPNLPGGTSNLWARVYSASSPVTRRDYPMIFNGLDFQASNIVITDWPLGQMYVDFWAQTSSGPVFCGQFPWQVVPYAQSNTLIGAGPETAYYDGAIDDDYFDPTAPPLPPDDGQPPDTANARRPSTTIHLSRGRALRVILATQVTPVVASSAVVVGDVVQYRYTLDAGQQRQDRVGIRSFDVGGAKFGDAITPEGWFGLSSFPGVTPARYGWAILGDSGLMPGDSAGPFVVTSPLLPGLMKSYVQSIEAERPGVISSIPSQVASPTDLSAESLSEDDELRAIAATSIENNSVQPLVIGPKLTSGAQLFDQIAQELNSAASLSEFATISDSLRAYSTQLTEGQRDSVRAGMAALAAPAGIQRAFAQAMLLDLDWALGIK